MHRSLSSIVSTVLYVLAFAARAFASNPEPGSLLLFPEFDNRRGQTTYLTLTNTDPTRTVRVDLKLVDGANCLVSDRLVVLTPRDTWTALTSTLAPAGERGYVYGFARSAVNGHMADLDVLIGSVLRIDGVQGIDYSVAPFVFQALTGDGMDADVDGNGRPNLDGVEYERAPNRICVPRFFAQHGEPLPPDTFASDLVLLQPLAGPGVTTTAGYLVYNDNEQAFSAQSTFTCWQRTRLLSISGVFSDTFLKSTAHAANEVAGQTALEAGWFEVRGIVSTGPGSQSLANPPLLGLLIDVRPNAAADLPFLGQ